MIFAAIYVPDFPLAALVRAEPELLSQALAVLEGTPPLARVIALNEAAGRAGVDAGMTQVQAETCLQSCPPGAWSLRRRSPAREAAAHAALMDCACAVSPRVEETALDTVLLDLAGLERIFGPASALAGELARRCRQASLEANVAVAANPDAALHAARGFAGVTVIAPGEEAERLGPLPVDVLLWPLNPVNSDSPSVPAPPPEEILQTLDRWGVRNLRALAALPEVALSERLGRQGLRLQQLARGAGLRPLVPAEPPLRFEESMELEHPVELLEPLAFLLGRLLEQLCARLASRSLATHELRLTLELDPSEDRVIDKNSQWVIGNLQSSDLEPEPPKNYKLQISNYKSVLRLPVPMLDAKVFLRLLQLDLKAHPPSAPVVKIRLQAEPAQPRRAQNGLFLPAAPEPEKLEVLLARLSAVVEKDCRTEKKESGQWPVASGQPATAPSSGNSKLETGNSSENWELRTENSPLPTTRVGSPELLDSHRPDDFRMRRFSPPDPSKLKTGNWKLETGNSSENWELRTENSKLETGNSKLLSALRLFRPPLRVTVEMREDRPVRLACPRKPALRGDVIWSAGPWRASGNWWQEEISDSRLEVRLREEGSPSGLTQPNFQSSIFNFQSSPNLQSIPAWGREEWDIAVRNEAGLVLYRLVRDLAAKTWFLEGSND